MTLLAPAPASEKLQNVQNQNTAASATAQTEAAESGVPAFARIAHPARVDRPVHPQHRRPVTPLPAQPRTTPVAAPAPAAPAAPRPRTVPDGTAARGFALYVGLDEAKAAAAGTDLGTIVQALKRALAELAPGAESYASIALAPENAGGRDVDVVRLALQDPAAIAKHRQASQDEPASGRSGVVVDISRKRLQLDGDTVALTYKEFELLQYLVLREGRTIERLELIQALWTANDEEEAPNERTIDVHVRRLRAKLARYEDIVRTVRGVGYRFDRHADVVIRHSHAPSPDLF